jgi:hypothetical protein
MIAEKLVTREELIKAKKMKPVRAEPKSLIRAEVVDYLARRKATCEPKNKTA